MITFFGALHKTVLGIRNKKAKGHTGQTGKVMLFLKKLLLNMTIWNFLPPFVSWKNPPNTGHFQRDVFVSGSLRFPKLTKIPVGRWDGLLSRKLCKDPGIPRTQQKSREPERPGGKEMANASGHVCCWASCKGVFNITSWLLNEANLKNIFLKDHATQRIRVNIKNDLKQQILRYPDAPM